MKNVARLRKGRRIARLRSTCNDVIKELPPVWFRSWPGWLKSAAFDYARSL